MKKLFIWTLLMACLLVGCGKGKAPQEEQMPPEAAEENQPEEQKPSPEAAQDPALLAKTKEIFRTITGERDFTVMVEKKDDYTELDITAENDWNVRNREGYLEDTFLWTPATRQEWDTQKAAEQGYVLTMCAPERAASIQCCESGDVVALQQGDEMVYVRAVNPREGELFEEDIFGYLRVIAQDAMSAQVWDVTADGAITDLNAVAADICVQVAENYRNVPDWVVWKPLDVQPGNVNVFDVYRGRPEQFCTGMGFWVLLEDPTSSDAGYWQAGAGLTSQGTGSMKDHWNWGFEVHVVKGDDGDWHYAAHGTGGYSVNLPETGKDGPSLEGLVDAFYLTEGFTHDWLVPYHILERFPEQLTELPGLLAERTAEEQTALREMLVKILKEHPDTFSHWTEEGLLEALGEIPAPEDQV